MKHRVQGCPIDRTSRTTGPWASNHTRLCKKLPNEKRLPTAVKNPCRLCFGPDASVSRHMSGPIGTLGVPAHC